MALGAVRPLARLYLHLRHRVFGRRYGRLVLETFQGMPLLVLPQVFNPVLFRTGPFLVEAMQQARLPSSGQGRRALDLGTGAGLGAICAARLGYSVVATDINPEAVRCARINLLLNRAEAGVEVRLGDLFAPVAGERFDLLLFNPPFHRGRPRDGLDHAWRGTDVFERFALGLSEHLTGSGLALVVLSTDGDGAGLLAALRANGHQPRAVARRDLGNEVLTVYAMGGPG
jgi:methylase of polypeptide subunit release factors